MKIYMLKKRYFPHSQVLGVCSDKSLAMLYPKEMCVFQSFAYNFWVSFFIVYLCISHRYPRELSCKQSSQRPLARHHPPWASLAASPLQCWLAAKDSRSQWQQLQLRHQQFMAIHLSPQPFSLPVQVQAKQLLGLKRRKYQEEQQVEEEEDNNLHSVQRFFRNKRPCWSSQHQYVSW